MHIAALFVAAAVSSRSGGGGGGVCVCVCVCVCVNLCYHFCSLFWGFGLVTDPHQCADIVFHATGTPTANRKCVTKNSFEVPVSQTRQKPA